MKKVVILTLVVFYGGFAISQSKKFEKGYFIDSNNKKVECLIKNEEWAFNPTEFEYKTDENVPSKTILATDIQELVVGKEYKFIKARVKIDKSGDDFQNATGSKVLNFVEEPLLLRVRVEGKANLYSYKNESYTRFFYRIDNNPILPLSYKMYYDNINQGYTYNKTYRQELLNNFKCEKISQNYIDGIEYKDSELYNFFIAYNSCTGTLKNNFESEKNYKEFELYATAGLGLSSFSSDNQGYSADFSKAVSFKIGLEAEINFSTQYKNWSVLAEVVFRNYSNSYDFNFVSPMTADLHYKAIDISVGVRKYFVINGKSFLCANGYLTYGHPLSSKLDYSDFAYDRDVSGSFSPALGLGYLFDKKYSVELRYEFNRSLFTSGESQFSTIGLMLGYKFL